MNKNTELMLHRELNRLRQQKKALFRRRAMLAFRITVINADIHEIEQLLKYGGTTDYLLRRTKKFKHPR